MHKMKSTFVVLSLFLLILMMSPPSAKASNNDSKSTYSKGIEITKENFSELYATAIEYDTDKDGWLSASEISQINTLCIFSKVKNLDGIENFTSATVETETHDTGNTITSYLVGPTKGTAKKVDLSNYNSAVYIGIETVSSLKLPTNTKNLALLNLDHLKIKTINLSSYTNLQYLRCYFCDNLSKLDLSKNKKLTGLWFSQSLYRFS